MSSLPGYYLEDFVAWQWNVLVEERPENNVSVGMAELLGTAGRQRPILTKEQFKPLLDLYEPYREVIEQRLLDFDEENQSWRGYAEVVDMDISDEEQRQIETLAKQIHFEHTKEETAK